MAVVKIIPAMLVVFAALFLHKTATKLEPTCYKRHGELDENIYCALRDPVEVGMEAFLSWSRDLNGSMLFGNRPNLKTSCSCCNYLLCLLLICGDVSTDPGPTNHSCGLCSMSVMENEQALRCDSCDKLIHNVWWPKCTRV